MAPTHEKLMCLSKKVYHEEKVTPWENLILQQGNTFRTIKILASFGGTGRKRKRREEGRQETGLRGTLRDHFLLVDIIPCIPASFQQLILWTHGLASSLIQSDPVTYPKPKLWTLIKIHILIRTYIRRKCTEPIKRYTAHKYLKQKTVSRNHTCSATGESSILR